MEVGQPATPAPRVARERAREALENERLGYTEALGLPRLRERIAGYMTERYGVAVRPERVVVTAGSSAGFVLAFLALLDEGDRLGLPSPGYPCYRQILKALNARPLLVETSGQGRWMPTVADVDRLAREGATGLLLASPNNPTGTMALKPRLADIAEACRRYRLWLISDEIYHGLEYEAPAETALVHSDEAIVVNSFSKYFSMTGWRLGWLVVPPSMISAMEKLSQNLFICASALAQHAALACFEPETLAIYESRRLEFKRRRDFIVPALRSLGFGVPVVPDGAFYVYADTRGVSHPAAGDSDALTRAMLHDAGVVLVPGADFGFHAPDQYIRLSYATAYSKLEQAVERLATLFKH
jgi:aspartate/methionine/tyrosine aminotransferase